MTASPVVDLWRALTVTHLLYFDLTVEQTRVYHSAIDQIVAEFISLLERRNEIVHAEWQIGAPWTHDFPGSPLAQKRGVGKRGLTAVPKLAKSESDLESLVAACHQTAALLGRLHWIMALHPTKVEVAFEKDTSGSWRPAKQILSSLYKHL